MQAWKGLPLPWHIRQVVCLVSILQCSRYLRRDVARCITARVLVSAAGDIPTVIPVRSSAHAKRYRADLACQLLAYTRISGIHGGSCTSVSNCKLKSEWCFRSSVGQLITYQHQCLNVGLCIERECNITSRKDCQQAE
jgi:hypothetical protein